MLKYTLLYEFCHNWNWKLQPAIIGFSTIQNLTTSGQEQVIRVGRNSKHVP
jgi:hypothetical protein